MNSILTYLKKPAALAVAAGILGIILGLIFAWGLWPVKYVDADPSLLRQDFQEDYLRAVIDSYGSNNDTKLAARRYQALGTDASEILRNIQSDPGTQNPITIVNFSALVTQNIAETPLPTSATTPGTVTPQPSTGGNDLLKYGLIALGILAVGAVLYFGLRVLRPMIKKTGIPTAAQQARAISRQVEKIDYASMGEEPPLAQFVTTYILGDDLFDDSFSIETGGGEFLGECGIGISETIGVTESPKRVSAFEVWLFDKSDIQTVTKVLMSSHAFNDTSTFSRLQAKGEPILVEKGKQVVLETAAIQLVATVADIEYGQSALPEESFFERLTLELAVWPKVAPQG